MFEIDIDEVADGEWFPYQDSHFDSEKGEFVFDPPEGDTKTGPMVRVRSMRKFFDDHQKKRKRRSEFIYNPKTRGMERVSYYEELPPEAAQKEIDDSFDYIITGIENFKNKKTGDIIKCTRENKLALMKVPAFDRFIGRCLRILSGFEIQQKEHSEKN